MSYLDCLIGLTIPQCNTIIQPLGFEALGVAFHDKKAKIKQWSTIALDSNSSAINLSFQTNENGVIFSAQDWGGASQLFQSKEAA